MKHLQSSDELQEKALLYAIGALPDGERREYARHLEEDACPVCMAESLEFQNAAQTLATTLPLETPTDSVKVRLLAQAQAEESDVPFRPGQMPERGSRWSMWAGWATAAAAVAAFAITLSMNSTLRRQVEELGTRVGGLESQVNRDGLILEQFTNPQVRVLNLAGQGSAPRAKGRIFWNEADRVWRVAVSGLPPAPADRIYQLWFVPQQGNPVSAEMFNTKADGSALLEIKLPREAAELKVAAVTTEPAGGLPQPSGAFVLLQE